MLIGGLIIQRSDIPGLDATIKKFRKDEGLSAELKWTKVSNYKLAQYKRFVDYFFALSNTDTLHFHSIVIDNHMVDHKKYSGGNKEKSFYKFYYQLFVNCFAKFYCEKNSEAKFLVYPDRRKTSYSLSDLKSIVNNGV